MTNDSEYKLKLLVNTSLKMDKGKIGAQCAHAGIEIYERGKQICNDAIKTWRKQGETVIVVKSTLEDWDIVESRAKNVNVITCRIMDEGRTQVPENSYTIMAVFGKCENVDSITRNSATELKLL